MTAPHAFLDILVNSQVRDAYLAGRISLILSKNLETILWANGAGARFLGFRTVADSIGVDSGFDNLTRLQIENGLTTQRPVKVSGIPSAEDFVVNAIKIEHLGDVVFLRSTAAVITKGAYVDLTDGLSDEFTEAAVLDINGNILSATKGFSPVFVADEELISLLHEVQSGNGIKKRLLKNYSDMPVGILELNKRPAIFLMIIIKPEQVDQVNSKGVAHAPSFVYDKSAFPLRFAWQVDENNIFTDVSPELESAVGAKYGDIIDKSFIDIMKEWDIDNNDAMRTLLKSHKAWSQCKIYWPVDEDEKQVEIEFSALPLYLRDRKFSGYRGFGIINEAKMTDKENNSKFSRSRGQRGLTSQEHEAFSAIARKLKADILAVELPMNLRSLENDDKQANVKKNDLSEKNTSQLTNAPINKQPVRPDKELDHQQLDKINSTVDAIKKYALSSSHNIFDEFHNDDLNDGSSHLQGRAAHKENLFAKVVNFNPQDENIKKQLDDISTAAATAAAAATATAMPHDASPTLDDEYKFVDKNVVGDSFKSDNANDSFYNNFKKIVHFVKDEDALKNENEERTDAVFLNEAILDGNAFVPNSRLALSEDDLALTLDDDFAIALEKEWSEDDDLINAFLSDKIISSDKSVEALSEQALIDEISPNVPVLDALSDAPYFDAPHEGSAQSKSSNKNIDSAVDGDEKRQQIGQPQIFEDAFAALRRSLDENGVEPLSHPKEEILDFWDEKFDYDQNFDDVSPSVSSGEASIFAENFVYDIDRIMQQSIEDTHQKLPLNDLPANNLQLNDLPNFPFAEDSNFVAKELIGEQDNLHKGPFGFDTLATEDLENYRNRLNLRPAEKHEISEGDQSRVNGSPRSVEARPSILSSYRNEFTLLQNLPLATLIYRESRVLFASDELLRLTGFPTISIFRAHGILTTILQEWLPRNILVGSDGEIWSMRAQTRSVPWSDGRDATMICFGHLEKQNAIDEADYKALQHKAVELSILLNLISDGILILDANGVIHSVNAAAQRMLDLDDAQIRGKNFSQFFAHKHLETVNQYFDNIKKDNHKTSHGEGYEVFASRKNGDSIRLFVSFGKMELDEGYFLMLRDLTASQAGESELIIAHHQAEEESQRKSRYLALVSHEVRTPLNAIMGLAELILEEKFGPFDNDRYRGYLRDIISSGGHIMTLVNDLLDVAKITEGQNILNIRNISIVPILKEALGLMGPQANAARIIMRSNIAPKLPDIAADKRSVKQIILNLLSNAIRFTPPGGQIIVSALRHENAGVLLRVRDSGIGMSKVELEEAMLPFHQISQPAQNNEDDKNFNRGTGLGLPLTKALADANIADFSLHSETAKGTVAEVVFSLAVNNLDDDITNHEQIHNKMHEPNEYPHHHEGAFKN